MSKTIESEKIELAVAKAITDNLIKVLRPHSRIINEAGSVRREKEQVGDIELVVLPSVITTSDLFEGTKVLGRTTGFINAVNGLGKRMKGLATVSKSMQIMLSEQIKLDLFMPTETDYYRIWAMRTGSADYSRYEIAGAWSRKGWCGTTKGLRRKEECVQAQSKKWTCTAENPTLPPAWTSERAFFDFIELAWKEPHLREHDPANFINNWEEVAYD